MNRRMGLVVAAAALQLAALAFAPAEVAAQAKATHVTVAPMTPSPVAWTAYFIAKPLGYYAAENLDVDVIKNPPRGSQPSMLLTGQITFGGLSSANNMPKGDVHGKLIWIMVHEMFPFRLMVLENSPIRSVKELRGKTIGMRSANDEPGTKLMMAGGGFQGGDYRTLVVGPGVPGGAALRTGQADAIMGTVVDQTEITSSGIKLREIDLGSAEGMYNGGIMVTADLLAKDRALAVRFARAVTKAYVWMFENPDAALDLLAKVVPEAVQDHDSAKRLVLALNEVNRPRYEARFRCDPQVFQRQIDLEKEVGILDTTFPASTVFTNDLLDEIWSFDVEAVKRQARTGQY